MGMIRLLGGLFQHLSAHRPVCTVVPLREALVSLRVVAGLLCMAAIATAAGVRCAVCCVGDGGERGLGKSRRGEGRGEED